MGKGGVVIISHNTEFTDSVCTQTWVMKKNPVTGAGNLKEEGEIQLDEKIDEQKGPDEIFDESGNKIEVKKKMETKDIKDIEKKLADHKKKKNLDEETFWEVSDRLAE